MASPSPSDDTEEWDDNQPGFRVIQLQQDAAMDNDDDQDDSDQESIPDEDIDFQLTYALHTFVATVDGQASVIKGDSLVLLDDSNVYWWLVRVLKTDEVGYIPAENIETPWERLARLNKYRNVELGHATNEEMQDAITYEHFRRRPSVATSTDAQGTTPSPPRGLGRRKSVVFAPPTYVDHPGVTWESSDDEDDEEDLEPGLVDSQLAIDDAPDEMDVDHETITTRQVANVTPQVSTPLHQSYAAQVETTPLDAQMEPDDGIAWSDSAARESQQRVVEQAEGRDSPSSRYGALGVARGPSTGPARPESRERRTPEPVEPVVDVHPAEIIDAIRPSPLDNQRASMPRGSPSLRSVSATSQVSASSYASTMTARSDSISPDLGDGRKKKDVRKKRSGVFSGLFKKKDKKPVAAGEDKARGSDESFMNRSTAPTVHTGSPLGERPAITLATALPPSDAASAISPHALRMQQMDQQQHKRYQEYIARSPGNEMEPAARAYGTQAAAAVSTSYAAQRLSESTGTLPNGRPGSIMIHPSSSSASAELTVLRVFAGDTVESELTFKTVLTNETTTAERVVRQAVQRLGLDADDDYYLVIKEVDGEQVELADNEKVLEKFSAVNQYYTDDDAGVAKRLRRSSVGSISSIASNLSQHPAIRKFASSDFTDDSSVKLFLHRRLPRENVDTSRDSIPTTPTRAKPFPYLAVANQVDTSPGSSTGSPTAKFSMQIVISADDLPEGMAFDSQTEAVIPKAMLKERGSNESHGSRKLLLIPRNATVAEAIEAGLERFGISGVVAGGDDVEDKVSKRRSIVRARYGLAARLADDEAQLHPSHKIIDAYREPPMFKYNQMSKEMRRRSREFPGASLEDIQPTDPVFVLRRVTANLPGSPKVALDEVEVRRRRVSADSAHGTPTKTTQQIIEEQRAASRAKQHALLSAQENTENGLDVHLPDKGTVRSSRITIDGEEHVRYSYISNDGETFDISQVVQDELDERADDEQETLLTPKAPDFSRQTTDQSVYRTAPNTPMQEEPMPLPAFPPKPDLLQRAISHTSPDNASDIANKLDRIIDMATSFHAEELDRSTPVPFERKAPLVVTPRAPSPSESEIADALSRDTSLSPIIGSAPASIKQAMEMPSRQAGVTPRVIVAPSSRFVPRARHQRQQPSIASILSDVSVSNRESSTPLSTIVDESSGPFGMSQATEALRKPLGKPSRPIKLDDDFGFTTMIHVIQTRAEGMRPVKSVPERLAQNEVERRYLNRPVHSEPQMPEAVQKRYASMEQKLQDEEKEIYALMKSVLAFAVEAGKV